MIRALEFYSGIGGLHLALSRSSISSASTVVRAFDWDQNACQVYAANHGPYSVTKVDISTLTASYIAALDASLWLLSPACQPYTVLNPNAAGASDPRAQSFLHLIETVLPDLCATKSQPTHLLVENVAGFETSTTRDLLLKTLQSLGYSVREFLLTPLQFGIPNSRLRYYFLARRTPFPVSSLTDSNANPTVWRSIPGTTNDWVDTRQAPQARDDCVRTIRDFLDQRTDSFPECQISEHVLEKWGRLFDIVLPSSKRTCCFTRGYTKLVERAGSILQTNEELDTTQVFDSFLMAQSQGETHAVKKLEPLGLRYFSPSELLRIFEFDSVSADSSSQKFTWPPNVSNKSKYRLLGNSVNVRVVQELVNYLYCDEEESHGFEK